MKSKRPIGVLEHVYAGIARAEARERELIDRAVLWQGSQALPRFHVREQIRAWYWPLKAALYARLSKLEKGAV